MSWLLNRAIEAEQAAVSREHQRGLMAYRNAAHVHVIGDGEAKINLLGGSGAPELVWADGMNRGDLRRAVRLVIERQAFLLARWEDIHGRVE